MSMNIRKQWIKFFESKKHLYVEPKGLVPINDDSILWINSGVSTIKNYFDGSEKSPAPRLVNVQRCIRTNDIENVGVTSRHQTIFEMLGNFSIGDYFKEKAILMAWEFLTSKEWLGLDKDKLYVTVFIEDQEAIDIWKNEVGLSDDRIIKGFKDTNFWEIGQGPCGPNTEIFFDRGEKFDPENIGLKLLQDDMDNDRYIEIWNVVFSQFNSDGKGNYTELPIKNIDTGMGFERIVSIMEGAVTNFDSSIFMPIIKVIDERSTKSYTHNTMETSGEVFETNKSFKIIADHFKAVLFAILDGELPSNKDRGYILRMLLRRAYLSMDKLELSTDDIDPIIDAIRKNYIDFYTHLEKDKKKINEIFKSEYSKYQKALKSGKKNFDALLKEKGKNLNAEDLFFLYETYGLPPIISLDLASQAGIKISVDEVLDQAKEHAEKSKNADKETTKMSIQEDLFDECLDQLFVGYDKLKVETQVLFEKKSANGTYAVILKENPFYSVGGGQVSDQGTVNGIKVVDVQKNKFDNIVVYLEKAVKDTKVIAIVDEKIRRQIEMHHSAAHLTHYALKQILGESAHQAGSAINENRMRFDYNGRALTKDEILQVENIVRDQIAKKAPVVCETMNIDAAKQTGAIGIFEDKYGDNVRVVTIGDSKELCGGCHVKKTSDISCFAITNFEQKSASTFRISAICGADLILKQKDITIEKLGAEIDSINKQIAKLKELKVDVKEVTKLMDFDKIKERHAFKYIALNIELAREEIKKLNKSAEQLIEKQMLAKYNDLSGMIQEINGVNVAVINDSDFNLKYMNAIAGANNNIEGLVIIAAVINDNKAAIGACCDKAAIAKGIKAGDLIKKIAVACGGNGGGRPEFAQAGANDINKLNEMLENISEVING